MDHFDFWHWVSSESLGHIKLGDSMPRILESLGPPDYWDFNIHNYPNMINYDDFYIYFDGNSYNDAVSIFCVYEPSYKTIDRKDLFGVITRRKHKSNQDNYCNRSVVLIVHFIANVKLPTNYVDNWLITVDK